MSHSVVDVSPRDDSRHRWLGQAPTASASSVSRLSSGGTHTQEQGMDIKHGLLHDYQFRVGGHINSVLYNPQSQTTVVHHVNGFTAYHRKATEDRFDRTDLAKKVDKLLFDESHDVYVGVCQNSLLLINRQFECVYEREFEWRILSAKVNTWTGEVVTSGRGNITTLMFRQGGRVITPSLVITDGIPSDEDIAFIHLEDVPGKAQRCFAAVGGGVKVFLMNSGKLLTSLEELHLRPITALMFFRPLRLLITAAKDGAIKVWDSSWSLVCTFVGHGGAVTSLVPYPYGPMIASGSLDCTLRVWNLATQDQVEMLPHTTPVEGLSCKPGVYRLLSHSRRQVKAWKVQQLYTQSALTGGRVRFLSGTTHPLVPLRVLAACADSAVRVVSPVSGSVITTALLPVERNVVSLVYFALNELLHVLDDNGTISVFNTRANPSALLSTWTAPPFLSIGRYTCLALYEMAMDDDDIEDLLASDKWLEITLEAKKLSHIQVNQKNPLDKEREGQCLLLAGTDCGYLALIDSSGGVCHSTQAPHESPVIMMACNAKRSQILTASQDGSLHVWRLYPHTVEPLSHAMTFSLPSSCPPSAIVSTRDRLCVACNNSELSSYSIDMFDINGKVSYTSQTESSHTDVITSLDAAPKLKLFASSSLDSTVRIWTEDNYPVRVVHLDSPADGLAFCSLQADIMIALHSHVHIISSSTYFDETFQKQLVSIRFPDPVSESSREWTVSTHTLPVEDRERLELVDNTISQDDYSGALSAEEMAALEEAAREKTACLEVILNREREIRDIRDGKITANKRSVRNPLKGKAKDNFWRELLGVLRPGEPRLNIRVPEVDDFNPDTYGREETRTLQESLFESGPRYRFFPPLATFDPPYPLAPDGYLPNSVLLQGLRKSQADQELAMDWNPPSISDKQRRLLAEMEEVEEGEEEEEELEQDDELMSRLQAALSAAPPTPTPSPSPPPTPSPPPPPKKVVMPKKPIEKLIAPKAPLPKPPTPPRTPTPPPPKSPTPPPTPPPPPSPLPEFIAQFIGQGWFDKLFPNASSSTFPRPWTVTKFIYTLLKHLSGSVDSISKGDICAAILKLVIEHNPGNKTDIYSNVFGLLTTSPVPSTLSMAERYLVINALKLIFQLSDPDGRLVAIMMMHFIQGDLEVKQLVLNNLVSRGVQDPEGYFERLLNKMAEEDLTDLLVRCQSWLEEWAEQLSISKGAKLLKAPSPAKRTIRNTTNAKRGAPKKSKVSFVSGGVSPGVPAHNPIDVINYFVTVEHENELAKRRRVMPPPPPPPEPQDELPHNTVIALPKINKHGGLIRLGETHCSCCHPDRETSLALLHRVPTHYNTPHSSDPTKLWDHFTHCLTLALRPQNVNPFLTEEERKAEEEMAEYMRAQRVSVSTMMKYFVPERSYVRTSDSK